MEIIIFERVQNHTFPQIPHPTTAKFNRLTLPLPSHRIPYHPYISPTPHTPPLQQPLLPIYLPTSHPKHQQEDASSPPPHPPPPPPPPRQPLPRSPTTHHHHHHLPTTTRHRPRSVFYSPSPSPSPSALRSTVSIHLHSVTPLRAAKCPLLHRFFFDWRP